MTLQVLLSSAGFMSVRWRVLQDTLRAFGMPTN